MKIRESLRVVGLVAVLALVCASLSQWSSDVHAQKQGKARSAHPISTKDRSEDEHAGWSHQRGLHGKDQREHDRVLLHD